MEGPGPYAVQASLNGISLGELAAAPGNEAEGKFSVSPGVPLSPEALRSLGRRNLLTLKNPNHDCFSIRRLWLELDLAHGRTCSSDLSTATYTQPPKWKFAEGILVPEEQDIVVELWFSARP